LNELGLNGENTTLIPPSIGRLKNLKCLYLSKTANLVTLPEEIGDLVSLTKLILIDSKIASLPSSIGRLKNLKCLYLSRTVNLVTLPEEIGDLVSLTKLILIDSKIASLPSSIGRLKTLTDLDLRFTKNLAYLPEEIGDLAMLNRLYLKYSGIVSLPPSIGRLKYLERLDLRCTKNLVNLPEEIGDLATLNALYLGGSGIVSLPPSIGRLTNLKELQLYCKANTELRLPEEILNLTNFHCSLSGLMLHGDGFVACPMAQKLLYGIIRNIARSRTGIGIGSGAAYEDFRSVSISPRMWPLVLHNAKNAFAIPIETENSYFQNIQQPDAIYQLLVDCRESFVRVLVNRE